MTEDARMNHSADFQLRGVLGMVARVRQAVCLQLFSARPWLVKCKMQNAKCKS
jgi:hypothetical protein